MAPRDPHAARLLDEANAALPAHLELLEALIGTSSHADDEPGVVACLSLIARELLALGFDPQLVSGRDAAGRARRTHLVATRAASGPSILVLGHADTVFPRSHPFRGVRREGTHWVGPGASDMKGGLVTALLTLRLMRERGLLDRASVRVVISGDEEQGSPSALPLLEAQGRGVDLVLSFEAARACGGLVSARKGLGVARLVARGRTGHAGIAHGERANALTALARALVALEAVEDELEGLTVSPGGRVECDPPSVHSIPAEAACDVEWRFERPEHAAWIEHVFEETLRVVEAETGATLALDVHERTPPMRSSEALVKAYLDAAARLGLDLDAVGTAGVGDVNVVAGGGAPCIDGVGPEGGGFHTDREHVDITSIAARAAMNVLALERLVGAP